MEQKHMSELLIDPGMKKQPKSGSFILLSSVWETQSGSSCLIPPRRATQLGSEAPRLCLLVSSWRCSGYVQIVYISKQGKAAGMLE